MTQTTKHQHPPQIVTTATASDRTATVPDEPRRVMPPMSEKNLQSAVEKLAKFHGYELVFHVHDSRRSQPGFPDLVLASRRRGKLLMRELKTDRGRVRPEQKVILDVLESTGADVGIWRPADLLSGRIVEELRGTGSPRPKL